MFRPLARTVRMTSMRTTSVGVILAAAALWLPAAAPARPIPVDDPAVHLDMAWFGATDDSPYECISPCDVTASLPTDGSYELAPDAHWWTDRRFGEHGAAHETIGGATPSVSFTAAEYGFWTVRQDSEINDGIQSESFFVEPKSDAPAPLRWVSSTDLRRFPYVVIQSRKRHVDTNPTLTGPNRLYLDEVKCTRKLLKRARARAKSHLHCLRATYPFQRTHRRWTAEVVAYNPGSPIARMDKSVVWDIKLFKGIRFGSR